MHYETITGFCLKGEDFMKVKIFTRILSVTIIITLGISNIAFAASDNVESETEETAFITELNDEEDNAVTEETENINTPSDPKEKSDKIKSSAESENEVSSSTDNMPSQAEQSAQVGDTFNSTFGIYQILTIGEKPTAMLVDKAQRDPNGNFIYGDTTKPWTVKYLNVEYAVTEIGSNCKLTGIPGTITIPEGVTYIHNGAFSKASAKRIDLPASLMHFDEDATCYNLELVTVAQESQYYKVVDGALLTNDGTKLILYPAMHQNDSYTSPESVLSVEEDAFYNNAYLKTITLTNVNTIKDYAFYEMKNIETIKYPKTLTNLSPKYVTFNCFTLKQIIVEDGNPILYDENGILFYRNENEHMLVLYPASYPLKEYSIPYGIKSVCSFAFNGITQTQIIKIPATVNRIYSYAFEETQIPIEFILHFSSPLELSQSAFDRLARGSKLYVESETIKNGFLKDFLTTNINENGGTQIDTETPIIIDYEKAVSRIDNWYVNKGKKYYYDINGNLTVGLHQIDQNTYLFGKDHIMKTGFQEIDGETYYFSTKTGRMMTEYGFITIDNKLYFIKTDHTIYKEASLNYNNMIYYFNTITGEMICNSLNHTFGSWMETLPASCTKEGSRSHSCIKCCYLETQPIEKSQHQFDGWNILTPPTCSLQGIKTLTCVLCKTIKQEIIPTSSHNPGKWIINWQATCQVNGKKELHCILCGQIIQETEMQRLPHKYGYWNIHQQATYTHTGRKTRSCSICGKADLVIIPKLSRKSISKAVTSTIKQKTYNGKPQKPSIKLILNNKLLKKNKDYSLLYKNNKKPGKATITIKGKRNYYGTKNLYFFIAPKAPIIHSFNNSHKRTLTIRIRKTIYASGYQLKYSTSKSFKSFKVTNFSGSSKTLRNLSSNKTYYMKIRSFKKLGNKKVVGPYSKTLKILIK